MSKRFAKPMAALAIIAAFASAMPTHAASMQPTVHRQTAAVAHINLRAKTSYATVSFNEYAVPQAMTAVRVPTAGLFDWLYKKIIRPIVYIMTPPFVWPLVRPIERFWGPVGYKLCRFWNGFC